MVIKSHEGIVSGQAFTLYVALEDDSIIGTCRVRHDWKRHWVTDLHVSESMRGRGIGSKLLKLATANLDGAVIVSVETNNRNLRSFYRRAGYSPVRGMTIQQVYKVEGEELWLKKAN